MQPLKQSGGPAEGGALLIKHRALRRRVSERVCAFPSEPGKELAVDTGTPPRDGLSHQLLAPPDGRKLLHGEGGWKDERKEGWKEGQDTQRGKRSMRDRFKNA